MRNYIHVNCLANIIKEIVYAKQTGIFYMASPKPTTISTMIKLISCKYNLPVPTYIASEEIGHNQVVQLSLGFEDKILNFPEALERYVKNV